MDSTEQTPHNQHRCESCGRWFNTIAELELHQPDCQAAEQSGASEKPRSSGSKDLGEERDWRSVP